MTDLYLDADACPVREEAFRVAARLGLPVLGYVRDTQNYIHLAARGLTLFDVAPGRVEKDLEQWRNICEWLDK